MVMVRTVMRLNRRRRRRSFLEPASIAAAIRAHRAGERFVVMWIPSPGVSERARMAGGPSPVAPHRCARPRAAEAPSR
jgi:hypothetical protein